jgi:RNA-directed DNA polymerase
VSGDVHAGFCERRGARLPPATHHIVGFEYHRDAQRLLADLRDRLAKFALELAPQKTRLVQFGRFAARDRARRGQGKPETFDFLGFKHCCSKTKNGRFMLKRITIAKRMQTKLREVKDELRRRRHHSIPDQGRWLASVVRGHYAYYAVPGNSDAINAFYNQVTRHWFRSLRRRSQRTTVNWTRMRRISARWLPPPKRMHPFPNARFDARTQGRSPVR